jgi:hypothetical protein
MSAQFVRREGEIERYNVGHVNNDIKKWKTIFLLSFSKECGKICYCI